MRKISTAPFCVFIFFILFNTAFAGSMWRSYSIEWEDHAPNPRFAIYDPGTPGEQEDDLVLDKETGLIWTRNAYVLGEVQIWINAMEFCYDLELGNLKGWRLATIEELLSLVDPRQANQPGGALPIGHPFINTGLIWSSTTYESNSSEAWWIYFHVATTVHSNKLDQQLGAWCVQGGKGYGTGNW